MARPDKGAHKLCAITTTEHISKLTPARDKSCAARMKMGGDVRYATIPFMRATYGLCAGARHRGDDDARVGKPLAPRAERTRQPMLLTHRLAAQARHRTAPLYALTCSLCPAALRTAEAPCTYHTLRTLPRRVCAGAACRASCSASTRRSPRASSGGSATWRCVHILMHEHTV